MLFLRNELVDLQQGNSRGRFCFVSSLQLDFAQTMLGSNYTICLCALLPFFMVPFPHVWQGTEHVAVDLALNYLSLLISIVSGE